MHIPTKPTTFVATILIILTLAISLFSFLPPVHAAVTALTAVTPTSGAVGQSVSVNGTIETPNGVFNIFFDSMKVKNGTAVGGNFTTSFIVPQAKNGTHIITLVDVAAPTPNATQNFTVQTSYAISPLNLLVAPGQRQEGDSVQIKAQIFGGDPNRTYSQNITVTTPTNDVYNATVRLSTDSNGTAESSTLYYPTDFSPGRSTNYTGTYYLRIYENATAFFIGLTNATLYHRLEWVNIRAMNYTKPNENATVVVEFSNKTLLSQIVQAVNGTIAYDWQVPVNASEGSYMVIVANATKTGTFKKVRDAQNFTVPGLSVNILTTNLNEEPLGGVNATVYEIVQSREVRVASGVTNSSGWAVNTLDHGGNYTFKAFWADVQVNTTKPYYIQNNSSWTLTCQLGQIEFTVEDAKRPHLPMPLIFLNLTVNYLTVTNISQTAWGAFLTNTTGEWILRNQLGKANYTIRAYRAPYQTQLLFNTTTFTIHQGQKIFNMTIFCPVLNLTIHAEDARQASLRKYPVKIYEFAGGLYASATTNTSGNVTFYNATFGAYKIRLYDTDERIVLNETYYNLVNASAFFILRSNICHANLSVRVLDYFGQPMPHVKVKLERENTASLTLNTDGDGVTFFGNVTGGNCYVSIYTGSDTPTETANVFVEKSTTATITLGKYVSIFGLLIDTSQFAVIITLIVFIVLFMFFMLYRRRKKIPAEKKAEKES